MQKRYPFKFLDAYTRADSDFFFGRSDEVAALYEMVFQTDLLLVYGASGTGKTSLIQCGLASKFQSHDWLALNIRRGGDLNASFEKALQDAGGIADDPADNLDWLDEDLTNESHTPAAAKSLSPLARRFKAIYLKHFKPLYLIFDQFEELYILGNKTEQERFIQTVREILLVEQPVKIILSIREEYLGHLYEFERAVPELLRKKLRVEPMNLDKVKTVIEGVGRLPQSNVRLQAGEEHAIAEGIFDKIRGEEKTLSIQLPYLQVFLDKLYLQTTGDEKREADAVFTSAALAGMGDIGDVLRNFLDEQVLLTAQKLEQKPESIWRILSPFVTLEGTKEPLSEQALCERLPDVLPALVGSTLQAFVSSRILRYTEHEQRYEIAHDSLAKQIHAKRSDEEIAILEVQRLVHSQVALKAEAREFFTEKQLAFIEPYLSKFKAGEEELDWIARSRGYVQAQKEANEIKKAKELKEAKARAEQEAKLRKEAEKQRNEAEIARKEAEIERQKAIESKIEAETERQKAEKGRKRARTFAYLAGVVAVVAIGLGVFAFFKQREANAASANVIRSILKDVNDRILLLDYDDAFLKLKDAAQFNMMKDSIALYLMEIAYFYHHTDQNTRAREPFDLAATLLDKASLQRKMDFEKLNPDRARFLRERYFENMVALKGGSFQMQGEEYGGEVPAYDVTVADFKLSKHETTVWQYNLFCVANGRSIAQRINKDSSGLEDEKQQPSWGWIGNHPVVYVSWYDAVEYANWRSRKMNLTPAYTVSIEKVISNTNGNDDFRWTIIPVKNANGFRLPTELEWEFAARGGQGRDTFIYSGSGSLDSVAWFDKNSESHTHAVGGKKANGAGVFDLSGNVWEWCFDWYGNLPAKTPFGAKTGSFRVIRGGSWIDYAESCRLVGRNLSYPGSRGIGIGFRLVFVP